ncbi:hypothetical protein ACD591_10085 [Rufibacter glacialis]|uniref:Uncharacterized protein n=1 Tax=Rufibacter glacialis TaxID=1259555 RepID=A0A5M8Q9X9_9BACT|nr:hypothetical protein [Rufibacter glacialis]KAA6431881.1 hypothetical protein FOE74_17390 [Rufibacter glacialis]GGK80743.1 hypothetical protein GCM10011405_30630 [Rufibacter glacialis]
MNTLILGIAHKSPFYKTVKAAEMNQIDLTKGESHYSAHSNQHVLALFADIKEESQNPFMKVTHRLDEKGRICFTTYDSRNGNITKRFICYLRLIPLVGYLLNSYVSNNLTPLPPVNNRSFGQRGRRLFSKDCVLTLPTEMTVSEGGKNSHLYTETKRHFEAGIAHIVYMLDYISGHHWINQTSKPRQNKIYATLEAYLHRNYLQLRLFGFDAQGNEINEYLFRLSIGGELKAQAREVMYQLNGAEDRQLLEKLRQLASPQKEGSLLVAC